LIDAQSITTVISKRNQQLFSTSLVSFFKADLRDSSVTKQRERKKEEKKKKKEL